ncbi:hypothetical protein C0993_008565 [Termitomyces sp. T159_Od127]|nr:hypothetical protein C0993_008565 [Termitomyces sp. T159_Od127]
MYASPSFPVRALHKLTSSQHVSQSDRPMFPEPTNPFIPYDHIIENSRYRPRDPARDPDQRSIAGPSYETIPARAPAKGPPKPVADNGTASEEKTEEDSKNSLPPRKPELVYTRHKDAGDYLHRRPPATPILRPEHRYCAIDRIVKPYRTHHCRNCGTVRWGPRFGIVADGFFILALTNVKFFINFIQAASVYTIYICVTLLVFVVLRATSADRHIDPQRIVIVAMYVGVACISAPLTYPRSGLFAVFTTVMQCSHFRLIWHGQTTVESMGAHRMRRREKQAMNDVIGYWAILCGFPELASVHVTYSLSSISAKRRKTRSYDEEWGRITHEGNIWWLGSGSKGWVDVMGRDVCGWFFVGHEVLPRQPGQGRLTWRYGGLPGLARQNRRPVETASPICGRNAQSSLSYMLGASLLQAGAKRLRARTGCRGFVDTSMCHVRFQIRVDSEWHLHTCTRLLSIYLCYLCIEADRFTHTVPIGRSLNDGLTYPVNPRFDAQGIWRQRAEWPEELR